MLEIKSTRQTIDEGGVKILVHGPAGAGKTRLCATTGDLEHTLIISAEGGLLSIKEWDIDVVEVNSIRDVYQVYEFLKKGEHEYKWVCLDSISELAEVILQGEKLRNRDARRAYAEMADTVFDLLRGFRNLPCHVVMTAKQGREESDGQMLFVPMLPGRQLTQNIAYLFDEVFALRVETNSDGDLVRVLQTGKSRSYEAKDRSGKLLMYEQACLSEVWAKISRVEALNEDQEEEDEGVLQQSQDGSKVRIASSTAPANQRLSGQDSTSDSQGVIKRQGKATRPSALPPAAKPKAAQKQPQGPDEASRREVLRRQLFGLLKGASSQKSEMAAYVRARCEREYGSDSIDAIPVDILEHWAKALGALGCEGEDSPRARHLQEVIETWKSWKQKSQGQEDVA